MIPVLLSSRRVYGDILKMNGISELDLISSRTRKQIQDSLELNGEEILYAPTQQRERMHLPEGVGIGVNYLA